MNEVKSFLEYMAEPWLYTNIVPNLPKDVLRQKLQYYAEKNFPNYKKLDIEIEVEKVINKITWR